jgi:hypothetical protein
MDAEVIKKVADQYEEQVRFMKAQQQEIKNQIQQLNYEYNQLGNKNFYNLLYRSEFGDYRQFVEDIAKELRKRNRT